jgi:hypothetical protein
MSVQIATQKQFQTAITNLLNGYTDANGQAWPGVIPSAYPPPVPLAIWAFLGAPRPTGLYVSLNTIGGSDFGAGYESPAVPIRDSDGNVASYGQGVFWDEDKTLSVQAHGAGASDLLDVIHNSLKTPWWRDVLASVGLVFRDHTNPRDISMMIDDQPEIRWVMEITFGLPTELDQPQVPWIQFVNLTQNYVMPDSTPAVPDQQTVLSMVPPPPPPPPAPSTIISRVGLVGEWLFTGESLADTSGNARDLTNFTNLAFASDGKGGLDLSFVDRSVTRAAYGAPIDASAWTAFSIAWECNKLAASTGNVRLISFGVSNVNGIQIVCPNASNDLYLFFARAGGTENILIANGYDATVREYSLSFDLASKAYVLYRDGVAFAGGSGTLANIPVMPNNKFVLGNLDTPGAATGWIGLIGKVRLYGNRVLTPAEALALALNPRQI